MMILVGCGQHFNLLSIKWSTAIVNKSYWIFVTLVALKTEMRQKKQHKQRQGYRTARCMWGRVDKEFLFG